MEGIEGERLVSLSTSAKILLDKFSSSEFVNIFRHAKLDVSLLINMKTTLLRVLILLNDDAAAADIKDMLGYAVFEVHNLFNQINIEAFSCKDGAYYQLINPNYQVLKNLSARFKWFNGVINSKLQKIIELLELLSSGDGQKGALVVSNPSHVLADESCIYGRDSDKNKLKHLLLSSDSEIRIISIAGMAGIGKTTVAKLIYNDSQVRDKFELIVWVRLLRYVDDSSVFETILESITSQKTSNVNLNTKRNDTSKVNTMYPNFLLVLDDVWDARSVNWILLMDIFNVVETGSRIIITTRDERVPISMQTFFYVHYMRHLETEDCWSLVARHAFGALDNQKRSDLEEIGREIAKKCDGLPLAAISVGALLHTELSVDNWKYVLGVNIGELIDYEVQAGLQLSYFYLSTPLKRCFAYCSIFPKESILEKKRVVQLWIAEGLVESSTSQASSEKVGEEYFDILVSRSLIQRRSIDGEEARFEMNNFTHDLASRVSYPYCIRFDKQILHERVHTLSYNRERYESFNKFDKLFGFKDLRTFLALPLQGQFPLCLLANKVVHDLLPTMKQLRVLSLSNYKSITEVPNSIGNLLYLRYLNLSHTEIERLPSETCQLYNLQFLLLSGCKRFIELPEDMGKLVNLCHLDVSDTALREMPVQIAKLQNLHTLSDFVVSKHNGGLKVAELGKFPHLNGKISISQLQNVKDPSEAFQANLKMKERIHDLTLEWDCGSTFSESEVQCVVLEHLQPSTNLKSLTIKGYGGISFPNWLGDFSFSNMVYLRISNCDNCLWLPPLGQLSNLKELIIEEMQSVQAIGTEFYGSDVSSFQPFPSLEILPFEDVQEWEERNLIGGTNTKFLSLKTLSLSRCPKLSVGNIIDKFPSLSKMELRECPLLVQPIPSSNHVFNQLMFPLNSLRQLTIEGFPSLTSLPTDGLRKTLKFLIISNCENLEFLPDEDLHNYTSLEELKISYSCNSMISFTLGALPVLKSLFIEGCKNLKYTLIGEGASEKSLSFLRSIKIWDCKELESFSLSGLPTPNLVYIAIWKCNKLHSLPSGMNTLTGLQEMEIDNLPNLKYFVIDDLPISLQELTVGSVGGIMWKYTKPTWKHLTCLSVLRINGDDTVNTLMVPLLPASLVMLCIRGFNGTRIDGKWLQHLTSLQKLEIVNAPKLNSLPKKGLPTSLSVLIMDRCPLLEASVRRKQGKKWRNIAHVLSIVIDGELIT
ncbi:putative P-loop containing nucleoside triphosphate hydrolase, leucine-rich repeat domain, L [Medicago truncatula]|nr:putative disease resistance RPP13-like protein 1 isoform X1 [Medicago truncatula]RHN65529.1 putative P-loop containing nucleoside triphosphate hydrolase, leucine-rich repeat domain, L [Medicago truncatula]